MTVPVLMPLVGRLESWFGGLYPWRWPITLALMFVFAAVVFLTWRRGWQRPLRRHPALSAMAALVVVAIALPLGNYLLSPLWSRTELHEASPLLAATAGPAFEPTPGATSTASTLPLAMAAMSPTTPAAFMPTAVALGEVQGADEFHFGRGTALLIETAPGEYVLRFEDFSVRNGPDLFVYLSPSADGYAEGALNLGALKATDGNINYEVPPGTDIGAFHGAVVWCREFSVLFATATLRPPQP